MLGRLEMDIDECIAEYSELSETVFGGKLHQRNFTLDGKIDSRTDPERLEIAVKTVLNHRELPENSVLSDGKDRHCKVFVCSVAKKPAGITRLGSYEELDVGGTAPTICEAALATSSLPTVFDIDEIGGRESDGALRIDNVVGEVEAEAIDIWCPDTGDLKPLIKCFLSIGTEDRGLHPVSEQSFKFPSTNVVQLNISVDKAADHFVKLYRDLYSNGRFYRFNVQHGLLGTGLAEYITKPIIEIATDKYLDNSEEKIHVRRCASNLAVKQKRTGADFEFYALVRCNTTTWT